LFSENWRLKALKTCAIKPLLIYEIWACCGSSLWLIGIPDCWWPYPDVLGQHRCRPQDQRPPRAEDPPSLLLLRHSSVVMAVASVRMKVLMMVSNTIYGLSLLSDQPEDHPRGILVPQPCFSEDMGDSHNRNGGCDLQS